jgi:hypothetical protein
VSGFQWAAPQLRRVTVLSQAQSRSSVPKTLPNSLHTDYPRSRFALNQYDEDFEPEDSDEDDDDSEDDALVQELLSLDGDLVETDDEDGLEDGEDEGEDEDSEADDVVEVDGEGGADEGEGGAVSSSTWKARRQEARGAVRGAGTTRRVSWEEQFEDDPLRGENPTRDLEQPPPRFKKSFVAVARLSSADQLRLRQEAWLHHMQWARRSALLPNGSASVSWEFTTLTRDSMAPAGQVLCIDADEPDHALALLASEPLRMHADYSWRVFEFVAAQEEELRWEMGPPYVFLGLGRPSGAMDAALAQQRLYHAGQSSEQTRRVVKLGSLREVGGAGCDGSLVVLNAVSSKDATRYLSADPLLYDGTLLVESSLSAANVQDVSGLHQVMARTFSQKTNLDPLHFQDPEDLLEESLPALAALPQHGALNLQALQQLLELNVTHRYSWLDLSERYPEDSDGIEDGAQLWNDAMARVQRVRLEPVALSTDDAALVAMTEE